MDGSAYVLYCRLNLSVPLPGNMTLTDCRGSGNGIAEGCPVYWRGDGCLDSRSDGCPYCRLDHRSDGRRDIELNSYRDGSFNIERRAYRDRRSSSRVGRELQGHVGRLNVEVQRHSCKYPLPRFSDHEHAWLTRVLEHIGCAVALWHEL